MLHLHVQLNKIRPVPFAGRGASRGATCFRCAEGTTLDAR